MFSVFSDIRRGLAPIPRSSRLGSALSINQAGLIAILSAVLLSTLLLSFEVGAAEASLTTLNEQGEQQSRALQSGPLQQKQQKQTQLLLSQLSPSSLSLSKQVLPEKIIAGKPWFNFRQVAKGAKVYQQNCVACHGSNGQGADNWTQRLDDGRFPPPPLDGSGHTWHHPLSQLFDTIKNGTLSRGGGMPAWGATLSDEEIVAVMAWFSSRWPKPVYKLWSERMSRMGE